MPGGAQQYLIDIMEDRRRGLLARMVKVVLCVLSKLYRFGVWVRTMLYDSGVLKRHSLSCLTISVGNITVGGTGKTPFVEALARALRDRGRNVAVLSRGYKSKQSRRHRAGASAEGYSPRIVSDGKRVLLDSALAGDEPYLLAKNLDGVAVLVDKNRARAGRYAISRMGVDTIILDDGFQYRPLKRTLDLVLVDCTNPFGNGHLLPRGILREPLRALKRADCFVLTKTSGVKVERIREELRRVNPQAGIIETVHQPVYFEEVISGRREQPEFIRGKDVYVVSAIARPESFETAIERLGGRIEKRFRFMDHHRFTPNEIRQILDRASADRVHAVVTTQKDAVRLPPMKSTAAPFFFLRVVIRITQGTENLADWVSKICQD